MKLASKRNSKKVFFYVLMVGFLASIFLPILKPGTANAQDNSTHADASAVSNDDIKNASGTWINRSNIDVKIGSQVVRFTSTNSRNNSNSVDSANFNGVGWLSPDGHTSCHATLTLANLNRGTTDPKRTAAENTYDFSKATIDVDFLSSNTATKCQNSDPNSVSISLNNVQPNSFIYYYSSDGNVIHRVDDNSDWDFTKSTIDPNRYMRDKEFSQQNKTCVDNIYVSGNNMRMYELADGGSNTANSGDANCKIVSNDSAVNSDVDYPIAMPSNAYSDATVGQAGASGSTDANGDTGITCHVDGLNWLNPLNWLFCGLINAAQDVVKKLDTAISDTLKFDTGTLMSSNSSLYNAWSNFRTIALGLLVIVGLVMVISQALGFGVFDAYTVKKVLPRIIAAVIMITFSWPLMKFAIDATNVIGADVGNIITRAFSATNNGIEVWSGQVAVGGLGLLAGFGILGGLGMLSFIVTAALGVIIALAVLVLRQVIIAFLVIVAPLAIVMFILPNTQKGWKLWYDFFSRSLIVYPIIVGFIAMGRSFAGLVDATFSDPTGFFATFVKFVCYFGPYFALPYAIRLSGGAVANLSGMVNDRGRGAFDRLRNFRRGRTAKRGEQVKELGTRASESRLFGEGSRFAKYNSLASSMVDPKSAAKIRFGKSEVGRAIGYTGGAALMGQIGQSKWDATEKLSGVLSRSGMNDQALGALTKWDGTQGGIETLAKQLEQKRDSKGDIDRNAVMAAEQLRNNASFLYAAHRSEEYGRASIAGAAGLAKASMGFTDATEISTLANQLNGEMPGMGNTFKTSAEVAGGRAGALTKTGYSTVWDSELEVTGKDGKTTKGGWKAVAPDSRAAVEQAEKMSVQDIGSSKGLKIGEGNMLGNTMIHALTGGSSKAGEIRQVLETAYASYNNASLRSNIMDILVSSEVKNRQNEAGNRPLTSDEIEAARKSVEKGLSRRAAPGTDEIIRGNEPQEEK